MPKNNNTNGTNEDKNIKNKNSNNQNNKSGKNNKNKSNKSHKSRKQDSDLNDAKVTKDSNLSDQEQKDLQSDMNYNTSDKSVDNKDSKTGKSDKSVELGGAGVPMNDPNENPDKDDAFGKVLNEDINTDNSESDTEDGDPINDNTETKSDDEEPIAVKPEHTKSSGKIGLSIAVGVLALALGGVGGYMAGHNQGAKNNVAVTAKNTTVTYKDLAKLLKNSSQTELLAQQTIVGKVFDENHGKLVSNTDVDKEVQITKDQYGSSFKDVIAQSGFTEDSFRTYTRQSLIMKKFVEDKTKISDDDMQNFFPQFIPDQEIHIGVFTDKKTAEKYKKDPDNKKYKDNVQKITLGTANNTRGLSNQILKNAYSTKVGKTSDVLEEQGNTSEMFVVVKPIKHTDRGNNWRKYKSEIQTYLKSTKTQDVSYSSKVLKKELNRLNIQYDSKVVKQIVQDAFKTQTQSSTQE